VIKTKSNLCFFDKMCYINYGDSMNNKGFTTVEVIVSFALVVIIMASMTTMLVAYRDSINVEETKTKIVEFKNSFTYMVYTDIVSFKIDSIQPCKDSTKSFCVGFLSNGELKTKLELESDTITSVSGEKQRRIYLNYNGIKMMLPDSDLNKNFKDTDGVEKENTIVDIHDFILKNDANNEVYSLLIPIEHKGISYLDTIRIVVAK